MAIEIVVPRLGWSMDEGTFVEWLKADGESVQAGDMLFVLEGEKAAQQSSPLIQGFCIYPRKHLSLAKPCWSAKCWFLLAEGESPEFTPTVAQKETVATPADSESVRDLVNVSAESGVAGVDSKRGKRNIASPRARRLASQNGISLAGIRGSGKNGRIRERDVLAAMENGVAQTGDSRQLLQADFISTQVRQVQPLTNVRRITTERMRASVVSDSTGYIT